MELVRGGEYPGWVYRVGTRRGIPGGYYPAHYIGIARAQLMPRTAVSAPARHSRPLLGLPHTWLPALSMALPGSNKGEIRS